MIAVTGLGAAVLLGSQLSAGAIVAHAKEVDLAIEDLSANVSMTITSEDGQEKRRAFRLLMRREGVNYRARITLLEPPEMNGTRFLVVASRGERNQQWAYFPDLDLVRQIAGRDQDAAFLGSDITYSDLAGGAHLDDLVHRLVGEEEVDGVSCYVMEGVPRHEIVYGKLKGWVRKDNFVTIRAVFFDKEGARMKEARMSDVRTVDGVPLAHRIEMTSLVAKSRTVLTITEPSINVGLAPDLFSEESLGKSGN
ncbi:MAG TPA: outer membrane lipoprotein-sorting protein [Vicinamibacteria bacterium]|jgi:outer membrane lipoprotein-sorting protein